jgi:hypothetical protein
VDIDREDVTLSPPDAAAVDALLDAPAGAAGALSEEQRRRQERAQAWLQVLGTAGVPEMRGDLAARTLAAVRADRMYVPGATAQAPPAGSAGSSSVWPRWRRRAAVIGSMGVAAALLLAVAMEGLGTVRKSRARMACAANLHGAALAFDAYAGAAQGELPVIVAPANHNWLYGNAETGAKNNTANLLPLLNGYAVLKQFICAGAGAPDAGKAKAGHNALEGISYSYRNLYGAEKPRWDHAHGTMVLADRNPVFSAALPRPGVEEKNSANHEGAGSYLLRADATVTWETSPDVGPDKDNIWTLGSGKERPIFYKGTEVPAGVNDVFLCP